MGSSGRTAGDIFFFRISRYAEVHMGIGQSAADYASICIINLISANCYRAFASRCDRLDYAVSQQYVCRA